MNGAIAMGVYIFPLLLLGTASARKHQEGYQCCKKEKIAHIKKIKMVKNGFITQPAVQVCITIYTPRKLSGKIEQANKVRYDQEKGGARRPMQ